MESLLTNEGLELIGAKIFEHLDNPDVAQARLVNRTWADFIYNQVSNIIQRFFSVKNSNDFRPYQFPEKNSPFHALRQISRFDFLSILISRENFTILILFFSTDFDPFKFNSFDHFHFTRKILDLDSLIYEFWHFQIHRKIWFSEKIDQKLTFLQKFWWQRKLQHFIEKPSKWLEEHQEWVPVFQNVLSKGYLNDVRQLVQILIDYEGFSANATPLHYACLRGHTRVVELIVQVLENKNPR